MKTYRLAALACLITLTPAAYAQNEDLSFDCVIKPREIVQVGSVDEGLLVERAVKRGDIVETGQVIARLDDTREKLDVVLARQTAEREIEVLSREAAAEYRAAESARIANLVSRELTAANEALRATLEKQLALYAVEAAKLDRQLALAELSLAENALERRTIKSLVSGIVTETNASPGDYISAQVPILTLAKLDVLNVDVFLPTQYYGVPVEGARATVFPQDPIGGSYDATIETVDRVFDAASGTFGVRLTIPNEDYSLPAGLRCRVTFETN